MRTTYRVPWAAALLLAAALSAPVWAATAPGPVLTGVVYRPDGRPAAKLQLQAEGAQTDVVQGREERSHVGMPLFTISTDAEGRYRVRLPRAVGDGPPPAGASSRWSVLLVSPQGYARLALEIAPDQDAVTQDLPLLRGDRVKGTVLGYPGGKPLAGADIYAVVDEGISSSIPISNAVTDEHGRFEIPADLPPGRYRVGAAAQGYGLVAAYDSGAAEPAQTRSITLGMVHAMRVQGRVLAADGTPVQNQSLELEVRCASRLTGYSMDTDARGHFAMALAWEPDEYDRWWGAGCREAQLSAVEYQGRRSTPVTIDPMKSSQVEVTLKLQ